MPDIKLTKVEILSKEDPETKTGGAHYFVWRRDSDGAEVFERTTTEIHNLINGVGGEKHHPKKDGHTLFMVIGRNEYDTPSGMLEEGQYAVDGDQIICTEFGAEPMQETMLDAKEISADGTIDEQKIVDAKGITSL